MSHLTPLPQQLPMMMRTKHPQRSDFFSGHLSPLHTIIVLQHMASFSPLRSPAPQVVKRKNTLILDDSSDEEGDAPVPLAATVSCTKPRSAVEKKECG